MHYILFIYAKESDWVDQPEAAQAEVMRRHEALQSWLEDTGRYRGCGGLHTVDTATCLRRKGGETFVTDGPYAETREQLGGYYVIDAADLDDALDVARRIPFPAAAAEAGVEIRPVADLRLFRGEVAP
jgi:hypothetical protein